MIWHPIDFGPPPVLVTIAELEQFAPDIRPEVSLDDDLCDAEQYPGGAAAWCRARRQSEILSVPQDERLSND